MGRYAVVRDSDKMILNIVAWDGVASWSPPAGTTAVEDTSAVADIGGWYEDGVGFHPRMPAISGIDPVTGATAGGTSVTLTGYNFRFAVPIVKFDGTEATNVVVVSDTRLTCETPAHAAGSADVTIENEHGSWPAHSTLTDGFDYIA